MEIAMTECVRHEIREGLKALDDPTKREAAVNGVLKDFFPAFGMSDV